MGAAVAVPGAPAVAVMDSAPAVGKSTDAVRAAERVLEALETAAAEEEAITARAARAATAEAALSPQERAKRAAMAAEGKPAPELVPPYKPKCVARRRRRRRRRRCGR